MIDTPGFDDTNKTDNEVLRDVATWLGSSYKEKIMLHGIIYLHRISDARMQGSAKRNLVMFKKLCGQDALKRVILVTTMWDKVSENEGIAREQELLDTQEFWGYMRDNGSICRRHMNQAPTAKDIIDSLARHRSTIATNIQQQMVDNNRPLEETDAGKELEKELNKERAIWAKRIKETEELMKEALEEQDREAQRALAEERKRYTRMFRETEQKTESLKDTIEDLMEQHQRNQLKHDKEVARLAKRLESQALQGMRPPPRAEMGSTASNGRRAPPRTEPQTSGRISEARQVLAPQSSPEPSSIRSAMISCGLNRRAFTGATKNGHLDAGAAKTDSFLNSKDEVMDFVAYGDYVKNSGDRIHFVCRVSKVGMIQGWTTTQFFDRDYPHAAAQLEKNGYDTLQYITLGINGDYFARWTTGVATFQAATNTLHAFTAAEAGSSRVFCTALGIDDSYLISCGSNSLYLGYKVDLRGHYPKLARFLATKEADKTPISIYAITLSLDSPKDYILIYRDHGVEGTWCLSFRIGNPVLKEAFLKWWNDW